MAFFPLYYPSDYHSAYRPILYRFVSTDYQIPSVFSADALIVGVRLATPTEVDTYGITATDLVVEHTAPAVPFIIGEIIALPDTAAPSDLSGTSRYPDEYRITRILSTTLTMVSASYVGVDTTGGSVNRIKGNYTVFATVIGPNIPEPVEFAIKPIIETVYGSPAYVFELDCRDAIARHFKDIKNLVTANTTEITSAEGYISMKYDVRLYAGYNVVGTNGVITFTRFDNPATDPYFEIIGQVAVNAIHPYHHVERNGTVDLDWADSFNTDHVMNSIGIGGAINEKRFLTYMDRDLTKIRTGDAFFLSWLWMGTPLSRGKIRIRYVNAAGSNISTVDIGNPGNNNLGATSYIANVGLAAHTAPAGAVKFLVWLINGSTDTRVSEVWTFNIEACKGVNKRWYYLNKLGGVDAFTFSGDETREMSVQRDTLSKPNMAIPEVLSYAGQTFTNDYQRRVWRTTPNRKYTLSSGFLLPKELRVVAEGMFESPNIFTEIRDGWWTPVIPITTDTPGDSNSGRAERFVIQYALGVDNATQRT